MSMFRNKRGQLSIEMVLIAALMLVFAIFAGRYFDKRGRAEIVQLEGELNKK